MKRSSSIREYSELMARIREQTDSGVALQDAITHTIRSCLNDGIMVEFLQENGTEVENMLMTEWSLDTALKVRFDEGREYQEYEDFKDTLRRMVTNHLSLSQMIAISGKTEDEVIACLTELELPIPS